MAAGATKYLEKGEAAKDAQKKGGLGAKSISRMPGVVGDRAESIRSWPFWTVGTRSMRDGKVDKHTPLKKSCC